MLIYFEAFLHIAVKSCWNIAAPNFNSFQQPASSLLRSFYAIASDCMHGLGGFGWGSAALLPYSAQRLHDGLNYTFKDATNRKVSIKCDHRHPEKLT
jgi:hypothetical protein